MNELEAIKTRLGVALSALAAYSDGQGSSTAAVVRLAATAADAEKLLSALEAVQGMPEALDNSAYSYGWDDARMATASAIREALNG